MTPPDPPPPHDGLFTGGGELGDRMAAIDWATTPLGPVATWPQSLKTCVRIVLTSRQPMFVWWGEALVNLYNDAYKSILGGKHPAALGQPASVVWREIWDDVGPRAAMAMERNVGTYDEALPLVMERNGYPEETYYTFSYSPVPNDTGGTGGILCANTDDTQRILGERQLATLRELASQTADARTSQDACSAAAQALSLNRRDLTFAAIYVSSAHREHFVLADAVGIERDHSLAPVSLGRGEDSPWPIADVLAGHVTRVYAIDPTLSPPDGAWNRPSTHVAVVPIALSGPIAQSGLLVVGLNPLRRFDDDYRSFLELAAGQIGASIANAQAHEEERRRAEALAEIDRAKTAFFSNVSHEFRTPLTLMLGPTEDALASPAQALAGAELETVYRNELRLLRLVNTLLDFSRVEAGRVEARFEPTDLGALTNDLGSVFRSAMERAGLRYTVRSDEGLVANVDRQMWEKIVLNLLSNALKFTFHGEVELTLSAAGDDVVLAVRDTGIGVAPEDLGRLFERFHRIEGARARTYEGSGIGLALVAELAKLHGGHVSADSTVGEGTTVRVAVPRASASTIAATSTMARSDTSPTREAFALEAMRWIDGTEGPPRSDDTRAAGVDDPPARILLADDNADMRDYVGGLLRAHWTVDAVADGRAALAAARAHPPDLVLTDVMMPELDGFALLRELRSDPSTSGIPVVMLSARAGEEMRIEGLQAGADDYLVKPFSARELVARVRTHLQLGQLRRVEQAARNRAEEASRAKDEFLAMLGHELRNPLSPIVIALELMKMRGVAPLEREHAIIERQVQHLVRLVDDLLDVSRITRGKIDLRREHVEISAVAAKAVEMAGPLLEQRRHDVRVDVPNVGLRVDADPVRLAQVIANLLTNAARYTDPNGRIDIVAGTDGDDVVLRVRDNGVGIEPELLPRVFERFVQGRRAADRAEGGLGLGLTLVHSLVQMHGGSVSAHSDGPGLGSEFSIRLPRLADAPDAAMVVDPPRPVAGDADTHRVLVVDDNADAASMLAEVLRSYGHDVVVANDGAQALALVERFHPDVAVLDIGLPVMDGYELAERLRERLPADTCRMIALTGYGQAHDRARSRAAGFAVHLVKPVELESLVAAVRGDDAA